MHLYSAALGCRCINRNKWPSQFQKANIPLLYNFVQSFIWYICFICYMAFHFMKIPQHIYPSSNCCHTCPVEHKVQRSLHCVSGGGFEHLWTSTHIVKLLSKVSSKEIFLNLKTDHFQRLPKSGWLRFPYNTEHQDAVAQHQQSFVF